MTCSSGFLTLKNDDRLSSFARAAPSIVVEYRYVQASTMAGIESLAPPGYSNDYAWKISTLSKLGMADDHPPIGTSAASPIMESSAIINLSLSEY